MRDDVDCPSVANCFVSSGVGDMSGVSVRESLESFTLCRCEFSPVVLSGICEDFTVGLYGRE